MILITGSSGFLGTAIVSVVGVEHTKTLNRYNSDYNVDLAAEVPNLNEPFEMVIHAAGKAHSVPKTAAQKQAFFNVNVNGTLNLLKGLEKSSIPKSFVFISSVAVYGKTTGTLIAEDSPLLANDAYGRSKIEAEKIVKQWCEKNNVTCAILRLPLIAGTNPPGNLAAMINGIKKGYYFNIDGGKARKSIVMANDVAAIIPRVAKIGGVYHLTDGCHPQFVQLSALIATQLKRKRPFSMRIGLARIIALIGNLLGDWAPLNSDKLQKITNDLTFDDTRAQTILGWKPSAVIHSFKIE